MDRPIGVFDSGVGGLTVARAIADQLPDEALHYVGDTANGPYGPLPIADVRRHALAVMDDLVASGVKMLVIACNTATAACLRDARERYDVPVVEVVLPAVRRAMVTTRTGRVGVIGTIGTITSRAYDDAFAAAPQVTLTSAACPRLAEFVERGVTSGRQLLGLVESYLTPIASADVDTLILGCTHYPLLTGVIATVLGPDVTLVSSAEETAQDVYRVARAQRPGATGRIRAAPAPVRMHRSDRTVRPPEPPVPRRRAGRRGPRNCHPTRSATALPGTVPPTTALPATALPARPRMAPARMTRVRQRFESLWLTDEAHGHRVFRERAGGG